MIQEERSSKAQAGIGDAQRSPLYHYYMHLSFGLMHVRVLSWFPFTLDICLNGREWLARQLGQYSMPYQQRDNCLVEQLIDHWPQGLFNQQLARNSKEKLHALLAQAQ